VKWLYPKDSGASLEADIELLEACGDLKALKANAKDLDAQIELLATKVKARMGEAAALLGPNGKPVATWKTNKDGSKTDWQAVAAEAGAEAVLIAKHTKTTQGDRPFLIK